MHSALSKSIRPAIAVIVVAAIVASTLLLTSALRTQHRTGEEIRQRFENVLALRRTQALLVDAETGQRGYLLTSQPSFLAPYETARDLLPGEFRKLEAGTPVPNKKLEELSAAKMNELARTLDLARSGHRDEAQAAVAGGRGKQYMDLIRVEVARRIVEQQAQLNDSIDRSEQFTNRTYWALAALVMSAVALLCAGLIMALRTQKLEAEAMRLRDVEQAQRQTALVARELNHRVKNLFSIVLAIVQLAGRGTTSPKEAIDRVRERVQALARAHEISLGANPMDGFDLETMLRTLLAPYSDDPSDLDLSGPEIRLPAMRVTPIGLIIHELATNAIKYGAWSADGGKIAVRWEVDDRREHNGTPVGPLLRLHWDERRIERLDGADGPAGFGSKLINAAVAQLDGTINRERKDHGISIVIDAPIIPDEGEGNHAHRQ